MNEREEILSLKIGRHEYSITEADRFMDNGACVQLLTQSKQFGDWDWMTPRLSKRAIKDIDRFERVYHLHKRGDYVKVFSLLDTKKKDEHEN